MILFVVNGFSGRRLCAQKLKTTISNEALGPLNTVAIFNVLELRRRPVENLESDFQPTVVHNNYSFGKLLSKFSQHESWPQCWDWLDCSGGHYRVRPVWIFVLVSVRLQGNRPIPGFPPYACTTPSTLTVP